jgi:hypothetical protein
MKKLLIVFVIEQVVLFASEQKVYDPEQLCGSLTRFAAREVQKR